MTLVDHTRPAGGEAAASPPPGEPAEAPMLQVLDAEGRRHAQPELDPWIEDVDADALAALYRQMAVVRRLDIEATHLQRQGELALWPPLLGQEAAQVGSAVALREDDFVFPSYRENGVALLRGVPALDLLRVWRGSTFSGWDPKATGVATQQIIIGAQALHAVGYAMGVQRDQADAATIVYFGDGATSQGDVNEAMVFSASYRSPVVFFCQNNHWAISEPVKLQTRRSIADRPWGFGIPSCGWTATTSSPSSPPPAPPWSARRTAAAPPSSRPSPTAWARTPPRTTPPATATTRSWRPGRPATR